MVRADRLVSLVLLLQARGRTTASALAAELGVSIRTIYRDLDGLSAAGVPVFTEPGPGGGCQLLDGYRFPLRGLRPAEAEALLILGVPSAVRDLGLDGAFAAAHRAIRLMGLTGGPDAKGEPSLSAPLVHLDMPGWFRSEEPVPQLRSLAEALRRRQQVELQYRRGTAGRHPTTRVVSPVGLVNKAGTWYLVAITRSGHHTVFRAGRITAVRILAAAAERPDDFDLAEFWQQWSHEFAASRPRIEVRLRASPVAVAVLPEVLGDQVHEALAGAGPPDSDRWQELTLWFEHELAAADRLAGFGAEIEVLSPATVRERLQTTARGILERYAAASS